MSVAQPAPVAIILAAGQGTRMKSRATSKVLFPVLGRSIVRRVVDAAREAGCSEVVVVVGHGADAVRANLEDVPGLVFAVQERRRGTGDAVAAARGALGFAGRTLLVLPADVPLMTPETLDAALKAHAASAGAITVISMRPPDPSGYGRLVRQADGHLARIVEHRDASEDERRIDEVNTGIYAMDGTFVFGPDGRAGAVARLSTDNDQGEYYLTDLVGLAAGDGAGAGSFVVEDAWEVAGLNDRAQLAELEAELRRRINLRWMQAGVTLEDPATTRIEDTVELARDVVLGGGVELRGACRVAEGAHIGRGSVLCDTTVGEDARLAPYVVATCADIAACATVLPFTVMNGINEKKPHLSSDEHRVAVGSAARVGPFSHLRQSSRLQDDVHVGNFVELKKTDMHTGAKANHLAYLGDAEVGARSNVGAGVITCNYDGFAKHRSIIGEDVFVGTDSHLVAPVRLGKGSYVATGTTVTKDVPADALAIGRARQENKAAYASRIREQLRRRAERLKKDAAPGGNDQG